jgi:hypothetical protein
MNYALAGWRERMLYSIMATLGLSEKKTLTNE